MEISRKEKINILDYEDAKKHRQSVSFDGYTLNTDTVYISLFCKAENYPMELLYDEPLNRTTYSYITNLCKQLYKKEDLKNKENNYINERPILQL